MDFLKSKLLEFNTYCICAYFSLIIWHKFVFIHIYFPTPTFCVNNETVDNR